jgi:integral membrane protein (TIGR01906 family)
VGTGPHAGGGIAGPVYDARVTGALRRRVGEVILGLAAALVIVAGSIVPFLNPIWVGFEQERSQAAAWTGYSPNQLRVATDAILSDLVLGPPTFDVLVDGQPVLNERERGHMADVRGVFSGFAVMALAGLVVLIGSWFLARRATPEAFWRVIRTETAALAVGVLLVGAIGLFAFDLAFDVFHRLFFAGGTYTFDPRTDRLVQLFPETFWLETSLAVGVVILVVCGLGWWLAGRRMGVGAPRPIELGGAAGARR